MTPIMKVTDIANCNLRSSSSGDMSDVTSAAVVVSDWFPVSLSFWLSDEYVTSPFVDRLSIPFVTEDPIIKHTTEAVPLNNKKCTVNVTVPKYQLTHNKRTSKCIRELNNTFNRVIAGL